MPKCEFVSSPHSYWLYGRRLPGITTILDSTGLKPKNEYATYQRGAFVHKLTELYDRKENWGGFVDQVRGDITAPLTEQEAYDYLEAWTQACEANFKDCQLVHIEEPMASEAWGFASKIDRVYRRADLSHVVVEIKTGGEAPWHRLQTAGEKLLIQEQLVFEGNTRPIDRQVVYLNPGAEWACRVHDQSDYVLNSRNIFTAAVAIVNYRIKHGGFWKEKEKEEANGQG